MIILLLTATGSPRKSRDPAASTAREGEFSVSLPVPSCQRSKAFPITWNISSNEIMAQPGSPAPGQGSLSLQQPGQGLFQVPGNGKRRGCSRRRCIENMHHAPFLQDDKIIQERSIVCQGLSTHA